MFKDLDDFRRQYALIPRHKIRAWIWKRTNTREPLNELVHEVNARISVLDAERIANIDSLESYVRGVCRHVAIDWVKGRQKIRKTRSEVDLEGLQHLTDNPEKAAAAQQELELLQRALDALPEKLRRVYWYRKIFGHSDDEIARLMSLDKREVQNTLRQAVRRIDAAMSKARGKDGISPDDCNLGFEEDL